MDILQQLSKAEEILAEAQAVKDMPLHTFAESYNMAPLEQDRKELYSQLMNEYEILMETIQDNADVMASDGLDPAFCSWDDYNAWRYGSTRYL